MKTMNKKIPFALHAFLLGAGVACTLLCASASAAEGPMIYYVNEVTSVTDAGKFKQYADQVPATFQAHGGKYIVRGGNPTAVAGDAPPRVTIIEFADKAHYVAWHDSPAYQKIITLRTESTTGRTYLLEGVAAP